MTIRVNLPKPGMGTEEGTVLRWLKAVGEPVAEGEPIVEIEFAKAIEEIEAPADGILTKILVAENETVPVNTTIAEIDDGR